jgi:hypothetical protein
LAADPETGRDHGSLSNFRKFCQCPDIFVVKWKLAPYLSQHNLAVQALIKSQVEVTIRKLNCA